MNRKAVSGTMLTLLLMGVLTSVLNIQSVEAEGTEGNSDDGLGFKPLIDATHAIHPFHFTEWHGHSYKDLFPESSILTFDYKHVLVNETLSEVERSTEITFDVEETMSVLGFEIEYNGPWGRMGAEVHFPDNTKVRIFNDTISDDKTWYFHFHNPPKGTWTLTVTLGGYGFPSGPADIHVIVGDCFDPISRDVLNKYDFLILLSPYQSYSSEEISIIHEFLSEGGSILVGGEGGSSTWGINLNQLLEPIGIVLGPYLYDPTNNSGVDFQPILYNFTEHPIAMRARGLGVDELTIFAGGALEITNPDVQIVLRGDNDTTAHPIYMEESYPPFAATLTYGKGGRLFVQGDTEPMEGRYPNWKGRGGWYKAIAEWLMEPWIPFPRTLDELKTEIEELGLEGEIDNHGIVTSLLAKLDVAQKLIDDGNIDQAKNILNAFINEVQAQSGKHITPEAAELLIESAEHILSNL